MRLHRLLTGCCVLLFLLAGVPAHATQPSGAAPALIRYMLAPARYIDMILMRDGTEVLRQPVNVMSTYIAISSDRVHTIEVYGVDLAGSGPVLIRRITGYRPAPGFTGFVIFTADGEEISGRDNAPAGKSMLRPIYAGRGPVGDLRFGGMRFDAAPDQTRVVNPQTALLELRVPGTADAVVTSEHLRVQPGYRYDIFVTGPLPSAPEALPGYAMTVVPVSPQFQARPTATRVFHATGHILEGRFRTYWEETGGLAVFGLPLNDDHLERPPEGAYVTQTFERNRFEYHPENRAPGRPLGNELLGRLGVERLRQLGRDWRKEWTARPAGAGCEVLRTGNTPFSVCGPLLDYYRAHGLESDGKPGFAPAESLALFGLPLTQARMETNSSGDHVLTQWFERARFELHPRNPAGGRPRGEVLLGRLGAEVYDLQPLTFDDEDRGFRRLHFGNKPDWREESGGFGGHYWWACAADQPGYGARWKVPALPGAYDIQVFVPDRHTNSQKVPYTVWDSPHDEGPPVFYLAQRPYSGEWVTLATMEPGNGLDIDIGNSTGEAGDGSCTIQLAADAIRLVPNVKQTLRDD